MTNVLRTDAEKGISEFAGRKWFDRVLVEDKTCYAVASLGSLVPGWLLVLPRTDCRNLAQLGAGDRTHIFGMAKSLTDTILTHSSDAIFMFEHGATRVGSAMGCGLDVAHLHLTPLPFDLLARAEEQDPELEWRQLRSQADPWVDVESSREYLLAISPDSRTIVAYPNQSVSQWFRRIIAKELGMSELFDYKTHYFDNNIMRTQDMFVQN